MSKCANRLHTTFTTHGDVHEALQTSGRASRRMELAALCGLERGAMHLLPAQGRSVPNVRSVPKEALCGQPHGRQIRGRTVRLA